MKALIETLHNISLGLFVNGSYGIMQGDIDLANALIVGFSVGSMFIFNYVKGRIDGRE